MKEKGRDRHEQMSSGHLKKVIKKEINASLRTTLECIEIKFGTEFDGFEGIRKRVLRAGNDAIRAIEEAIDNQFSISQDNLKVHTVEFKR